MALNEVLVVVRPAALEPIDRPLEIPRLIAADGEVVEDGLHRQRLVLPVALLDRLLHHSVVLNIRGDSYRQRHRKNAGLTSLQGAMAENEELRGTNM